MHFKLPMNYKFSFVILILDGFDYCYAIEIWNCHILLQQDVLDIFNQFNKMDSFPLPKLNLQIQNLR